MVLARLHRWLLGCWHVWWVVGSHISHHTQHRPWAPLWCTLGGVGCCRLGRGYVCCNFVVLCVDMRSSLHVVFVLCGPPWWTFCRRRLDILDQLQVHGRALVSALCRLRCKAPLMQTMWWGWRRVPSQGGGCQVAPSSCRSFEGWLLLLDFALVTCSLQKKKKKKKKK